MTVTACLGSSVKRQFPQLIQRYVGAACGNSRMWKSDNLVRSSGKSVPGRTFGGYLIRKSTLRFPLLRQQAILFAAANYRRISLPKPPDPLAFMQTTYRELLRIRREDQKSKGREQGRLPTKRPCSTYICWAGFTCWLFLLVQEYFCVPIDTN